MPIGIYVHIPFCRAKCNYCDFNSAAAPDDKINDYVKALCSEISRFDDGLTADSVFFGGGTPTVLKPSVLADILDTIRCKFKLTTDCEITAECNPATADENALKEMRKTGFNRLSVGMQSSCDDELKILGRIHSASDCEKCIFDAKNAGFENVSVDLMYGIPNQDEKSFLKSLKTATAYKPKHISCYALSIEKGTPFANMKLNIADDDTVAKMYETAVEYLKLNGYARYEISNFALNGMESRHNLKYWMCDDYIGFGAGAHSCMGSRRFSNIRNTDLYISAVNSKKSLLETETVLDTADKMSEFVFLGLRTREGVRLDEFKKRFNRDATDVFEKETAKNITRGTLEIAENRLRIPDKYVFVSNMIMSDFV